MENREISIKEIFLDIVKRRKQIIILAVAFGIIMGLIGGLKRYNSKTVTGKLLVIQKADIPTFELNKNGYYQEISIDDIITIINSDKILDQVFDNCNFNENLGLTKEKIDYSKIFSVTKDSNSNLIIISCNITDIELAKESINSVVNVFKSEINEITEMKKIELISGPSIEEKDGLLVYAIKIGIIGTTLMIAICAALIFIKDIFDDYIRTEKEIKTVLDYYTISYKNDNDAIEVIDFMSKDKNKIINFIGINKNITKERIIHEIARKLEHSGSNVLIIDLQKIDSNFKSYFKSATKKYEYILINSKCVKESHDYVNISKIVDGNILIVEKEIEKYEDLERIKSDIDYYGINIIGTIFIKH